MTEQTPPEIPPTVLCPQCGLLKVGGLIRIQKGQAGGDGPVVFHGCSDCLIHIIGEYSLLKGPSCYLCGAKKEKVLYPTGASRMECPVHVHGKALMGRALADLDDQSQVAKDIRDILQVRPS